MRRDPAGAAHASGLKPSVPRAWRLLAACLLLLLAGPVSQVGYERLLPSGLRHARRGEREEPHLEGMAAFTGSDATAHAVSAVSSWRANRQRSASTAKLATATQAELERLHFQQREMVQLHLGPAGAEVESWAQVLVSLLWLVLGC
jgi:hypothetical protein